MHCAPADKTSLAREFTSIAEVSFGDAGAPTAAAIFVVAALAALALAALALAAAVFARAARARAASGGGEG